jgi:hypothetical protein
MTRQDDNIRKRIKSTEEFVPFTRLQHPKAMTLW